MWAKLNMNENTMTLFDFVESCPLVYFFRKFGRKGRNFENENHYDQRLKNTFLSNLFVWYIDETTMTLVDFID